MRNFPMASATLTILLSMGTAAAAETGPVGELQADLLEQPGAVVTIELEAGGDMLVQQEGQTERVPMSVVANLSYRRHILDWSPDPHGLARALRHYNKAEATIKVSDEVLQQQLAEEHRWNLAEIRAGQSAINGQDNPLTREALDLVHVVGNSLAIDRLLPGCAKADGEGWDHEPAVIGALLGMEHVAACEVSSVVVGRVGDEVQIQTTGTVHGLYDGAPTEIELKAAFLFHLGQERITKFNLAIKEHRNPGVASPGLDIVAKVKMQIARPSQQSPITPARVVKATAAAQPLSRVLAFNAPRQGYQLRHDRRWFVMAENRELVSLRCVQGGELTAHCNITTLPARSEGRQTNMQQFELDIRELLGEHLQEVAVATQWTTANGHQCLGIIANGRVDEVPMQWRYYLISTEGLPRVTIAVTVERSRLESFADADRQIVDSLKLIQPTRTASADQQAEQPPHQNR